MKKLFILLFLLFAVQVNAATYYCDPVAGNTATGNGSAGLPWGTLESVFDASLIQQRVHKDYPAIVEELPGSHPDSFEIKSAGSDVVVDGDTIKCMTGYHGRLNEAEYYNTDYITIEPGNGETPTFGSIQFHPGSFWKLKNLTVSNELIGGGTWPKYHIRALGHGTRGHSSFITVEDCTVFTAADTSEWTAQNWTDRAGDGIILPDYRPGNKAINNTITDVKVGLNIGGDNSLSEYNTIRRFSEDAYRIKGGDNQVCRYNDMRDSINVDLNHDDGMQLVNQATTVLDVNITDETILIDVSGWQAWVVGRDVTINDVDGSHEVHTIASSVPVDSNTLITVAGDLTGSTPTTEITKHITNFTLRNNIIIGIADADVPFVSSVQLVFLGEGCHGWQIENNLLVGASTHGISIESPRDCNIVNNTVVREPENPGGNLPGISLTNNSNVDSDNCLVRNNIATNFSIAADSNHTEDHNIDADEESEWQALFVDYNGYDFQLKGTANAVDAGSAVETPSTDILDNARDANPDIGAYEFISSASVTEKIRGRYVNGYRITYRTRY